MFIHVLNNSIVLTGIVAFAGCCLLGGYHYGYNQALTRRSRQEPTIVAVPTNCKGIELPVFLKHAKKAPKGA